MLITSRIRTDFVRIGYCDMIQSMLLFCMPSQIGPLEELRIAKLTLEGASARVSLFVASP